MSWVDFRELCELTRKMMAKGDLDFRAWMFSLLISVEAKESLFDETIPDRASQARLRSVSPLADRIVTESARLAQCGNLKTVETVVGMLAALRELKKNLDLDPDLAAASDGELQASRLVLSDLYRALIGRPNLLEEP